MNLLIGDSHIYKINIRHPNDLIIIHGASSCGLNNAESLSQSQKQVLDSIHKTHYERIFLNFGNVDVSHIFIFKLCKDDTLDYRTFNENTVNRYISFIEKHLKEYQVVCLSVGLPPLDDDNLIENILLAYRHKCLTGHTMSEEELADTEKLLRNTRLPDLYTRTNIVQDFNDRLKTTIDTLSNKNIRFMDITTFTYDPIKLRIRDEFYTRNDIHNFNRNDTISQMINSYIDELK